MAGSVSRNELSLVIGVALILSLVIGRMTIGSGVTGDPIRSDQGYGGVCVVQPLC